MKARTKKGGAAVFPRPEKFGATKRSSVLTAPLLMCAPILISSHTPVKEIATNQIGMQRGSVQSIS